MNYFLGQIGIFGFNFAPRGWALCAGNILPISQNTALYSLLGTTYGGNGQSTFGLPDLRSRTPMMFGQQTSLGEMAGTETVTLLAQEMALHTHLMGATNAAATIPGEPGHIFAQGQTGSPAHAEAGYKGGATPNVVLNPLAVTMAGGNQPHNNIQPSLGINFCISTTGYYPSRN